MEPLARSSRWCRSTPKARSARALIIRVVVLGVGVAIQFAPSHGHGLPPAETHERIKQELSVKRGYLPAGCAGFASGVPPPASHVKAEAKSSLSFRSPVPSRAWNASKPDARASAALCSVEAFIAVRNRHGV